MSSYPTKSKTFDKFAKNRSNQTDGIQFVEEQPNADTGTGRIRKSSKDSRRDSKRKDASIGGVAFRVNPQVPAQLALAPAKAESLSDRDSEESVSVQPLAPSRPPVQASQPSSLAVPGSTLNYDRDLRELNTDPLTGPTTSVVQPSAGAGAYGIAQDNTCTTHYGLSPRDTTPQAQAGAFSNLDYRHANPSTVTSNPTNDSEAYEAYSNLSSDDLRRLYQLGYDLITPGPGSSSTGGNFPYTPHLYPPSDPPIPDASPGRSAGPYPWTCGTHGTLPVLFSRRLLCGCEVMQDVNGQTVAKAGPNNQ